jgi:hypothetical protein
MAEVHYVWVSGQKKLFIGQTGKAQAIPVFL